MLQYCQILHVFHKDSCKFRMNVAWANMLAVTVKTLSLI